MELVVVDAQHYRELADGVPPEDIGMRPRTFLGHDLIVGSYPPLRGKQELAKTVMELQMRVDIVKAHSESGVWVTSEGDVWRIADLEADIERMKTHESYDYSKKCMDVVVQVSLLGERIEL